MKSAGRVAPALILILGVPLLGCQIPGARPALDVEATGQPATSAQRARVETWVEEARAARSARTSLRAFARARFESASGKARVREVIAAERPARLRVETINFLGTMQSLLVADGADAWLFDGRDLVEDASPSELLVRLGLDLSPEEAIDLLLAAPDLPGTPPRRVWVLGDEPVAEFDRQRVRWSSGGQLRGIEALAPGGEVAWTVEYDAWSEVAGGRHPLQIRAYFPRTELRAEFELEDVELNAELDASLFRIARTPE